MSVVATKVGVEEQGDEDVGWRRFPLLSDRIRVLSVDFEGHGELWCACPMPPPSLYSAARLHNETHQPCVGWAQDQSPTQLLGRLEEMNLTVLSMGWCLDPGTKL